MSPTITPQNIIAAALVIQMSIAVMMALGAHILKRGERSFMFYEHLPSLRYSWVMFWFFLVTVAMLMLTDAFSQSWKPLLGSIHFLGIPWSSALRFTFYGDIFFVSFMIFVTGGSYRSPFTPILFILPVLAIFLREESGRIFSYTFVVIVLFSCNFASEPDRESKPANAAYWIVSVLSFCLSTGIGFATRPQ